MQLTRAPLSPGNALVPTVPPDKRVLLSCLGGKLPRPMAQMASDRLGSEVCPTHFTLPGASISPAARCPGPGPADHRSMAQPSPRVPRGGGTPIALSGLPSAARSQRASPGTSLSTKVPECAIYRLRRRSAETESRSETKSFWRHAETGSTLKIPMTARTRTASEVALSRLRETEVWRYADDHSRNGAVALSLWSRRLRESAARDPSRSGFGPGRNQDRTSGRPCGQRDRSGAGPDRRVHTRQSSVNRTSARSASNCGNASPGRPRRNGATASWRSAGRT